VAIFIEEFFGVGMQKKVLATARKRSILADSLSCNVTDKYKNLKTRSHDVKKILGGAHCCFKATRKARKSAILAAKYGLFSPY
jgi:hypothetical protein